MDKPNGVPAEHESTTSNKPVVRRARRGYRWLLIALITIGVALGLRSYWWPIPFQIAARHSLDLHEDVAALEWLNWATWMSPEDGETAFLRMRIFRRTGHLDQMAGAMKRAYERHYSGTKLQREQWLGQAQFGQLADVERHLATMLADPQGDTAEICEAYVVGYVQMGRVSSALQILQSWITDWPAQARPYLLRARIWNRTAKFLPAIEDLQRAQQLEPTNVEVQFEFASTLHRDGQIEPAINGFTHCLNDRRFAVRARTELAQCLRTTNDVLRAQKLLDQAVRLEPDNVSALTELGRLYLECGRSADAVTTLQSAAQLATRDRELDDLLGQALWADSRMEQAKAHLRRP